MQRWNEQRSRKAKNTVCKNMPNRRCESKTKGLLRRVKKQIRGDKKPMTEILKAARGDSYL